MPDSSLWGTDRTEWRSFLPATVYAAVSVVERAPCSRHANAAGLDLYSGEIP